MAYQEKYIINKPLVAGLRKGGMWREGGGEPRHTLSETSNEKK